MDASILYWTKIAAIGQVAGAIATLLAVIAALYLARSERRIRVKVAASLSRIVDARGAIQTVTVTVENIGLRTAKIDAIGWIGGVPTWRLPRAVRWIVPRWLQQETLHQIPDYASLINDNFPWRLEPYESKSTHFKREDFLREFSSKQGNVFFRNIPLINKIVSVRPRVYVAVDTKPVITGLIAQPLLTQMKARHRASRPD